MSDHEFEKQVHQKLQELKLRPSDGVWMEVEKSIRQGKSRRRFMWWWMAALFVGVTAGGYILYNYTAQTHSNAAAIATTTATSLSNTKSAEITANSTNHTTTVQPVTEKNITGEEKASQQQSTVETPSVIAETTESKTITATTTNKNKKPVQQPLTYNSGNTDPAQPINTIKLTHEKQHRANKKGARGSFVIAAALTQHRDGGETWATLERETVQAESEPNTLSIMPVRINEVDNDIATNKATTTPLNNRLLPLLLPDSLSNTPAVAQPIQRRKPSLWHWGVVADAGYSRIAESKLFQLKGLLGTDKYIAEDLSARSNASPATNNGTTAYTGSGNSQMVNWSAYTTPPKKASPIQADVSFSVGLFVQRAISPRFKLSLGLEYNYLSVHTQVGQKINSPANPIVVNMGTSQAALVKEYYKSPGTDNAQAISSAAYNPGTTISQRYTYRFHYLEIPLIASWQINKGRKLPPFQLEAGVSMARLLSVDALHYEGIKGVYYQDNDLFNKTQFNFVAGLSVGLLQHSKHPLWIGPNLRYALNGLVNKEVSTGQYAWSAGVSIKMILGKL